MIDLRFGKKVDRWWREMGSDLHRKGKQIFVKLFVFAIVLGISFRLLFSGGGSTTTFLPVPEPSAAGAGGTAVELQGFPSMPETTRPISGSSSTEKSDLSNNSPSDTTTTSSVDVPPVKREKCDLFTGEWIPNPSGPAYTNATCPFIESPQNCLKNGRPDTGYLYWRWKPHGCNVPPFDEIRFLKTMRNKQWAFVGDSILRNHVQSMLCLLAKVEAPVEVYHDKGFKSRTWHFPTHNFTLSVIWSPFLAKAETFEDNNGASSSEVQLHLDVLDQKWISQYQSFDYILISGGQWFLKSTIYWENDTVIGCHNCPTEKNSTEIGIEVSYRKVLQMAFRFFNTSSHKPLVMYRTWTPDHFENGQWFDGGTCNRTAPYKEGEFAGRDIDRLMLGVELEAFGEAVRNGTWGGARLKLLDTYRLSLLRPDGHSGPYRDFHPFAASSDRKAAAAVQNDCLHWCLPGPVDAWNDLLMELVFEE